MFIFLIHHACNWNHNHTWSKSCHCVGLLVMKVLMGICRMNLKFIWVRSRRCCCLVTWICCHLIAKTSNKTASPSWPGLTHIKIWNRSLHSFFCYGNVYSIEFWWNTLYRKGTQLSLSKHSLLYVWSLSGRYCSTDTTGVWQMDILFLIMTNVYTSISFRESLWIHHALSIKEQYSSVYIIVLYDD